MYHILGKHLVDTSENHAQIIDLLLKRIAILELSSWRIRKKLGIIEDDQFEKEIQKLTEAEDVRVRDSLANFSNYREQLEAFLETARKFSEQS